MPRLRTAVFALLASVALASHAAAQPATKKALQHEDYDIWNRLTGQQISANGAHALYGIASEATDPRLHIVPLGGGEPRVIERGEGAQFSQDGRFVVFRLVPAEDTLDAMRERDVPNNRLPGDTMAILDLQTGQIVHRVERIRNFEMPSEAGGWLAYQVNDSTQANAGGGRGGRGGRGGAAGGRGGRGGRGGGEQNDTTSERRKDPGYKTFVRNLATGEERTIEDVTTYDFTDDGTRMFYIVSHDEGTTDGIYLLDLQSGNTRTLLAGKAEYRGLAYDEDQQRFVVLTNKDDYAAEQPAYALYAWDGGSGEARLVANTQTPGIPQDWWITENSSPEYSKNGQRIFFGTQPRPEPEPDDDDEVPEDERVTVDIWAWTDPQLQPQQLRQVQQERRRTYQGVLSLADGRFVQLARPDMPDITLVRDGDADFAIGRSNLPYRIQSSWGAGGTDYYRVNLATGERETLLEYLDGNASVSPTGKYLTWFDGEKEAWFAMDLATRNVADISAQIPHPIVNEQHDTPDLPGSYGNAGWTQDDGRFLLNDAFDIWAVDPTGREAPRNLTEGVGRRENMRFRLSGFGREDDEFVDFSKDVLLTAAHQWTKAEGFYRDRFQGNTPPSLVHTDDRSFGNPSKADNANVVLITRGSFSEFNDLYVTDPDFSSFRRISDANPQQAEYRWGSAELVDWMSTDGERLQGVLYKPEGFDPTQQYPMMVYFYERLSNNLHNYVTPSAGSSSINIAFYVSRGYLVFTPDIPYKVGYPGESAMNAIVPGVLSLIDEGFVKPDRIGLQGHSWGGYQIAYMITRTNMFAAVEAGAPVSNMTSAYGGIRWSSGLVRQFQYEKTQSRIGGSLWERPLQFIENSPIFWADKVQTPLLMLHNDEDGAVPWYQGIEYFTALRRLSRPVWMFNYNGEAHGLGRAANRKDWAIRMQQFFDHYLMDAPPPVWLVEGLPAVLKGRSLGLELVDPKKSTTDPQGGGGPGGGGGF
jgi:dipeptidyl aminopeptidase/acylaminoacyl peptidase